ncbi:MAG: helix-turn-helix domain-containing protein [Clostridium sp.]|uniref:helix-turn-helix domain-containing protein n=1 Tax=Clostridium innocuum TaxID=1522 RepID=UPI001E5FEC8A|nr:helix-turn-helix transcriptional regulator [[Clostridium] innocuum]MCC2834522.1 helix-turn-helix transcriptional regulator [[Clostridium] innocuum]MCR0504740.1 helix-turn-helix transcriptional regulator [[Clostridium] innocuum]
MNGRIKLIRKTLGISQRDFGKKIGISDTAVSKLESGERNPSEQTLKSICREFNVDYFWLTEGADVDMFMKLPNTLMEKLSERYNLNKKSQMVLKTYLEAPDDEKEAIENFLTTLAENLQKEGKK